MPATSSLGDTPRVVQFATESVLKPISEENVKVTVYQLPMDTPLFN